jgi:hypothetical protein
MILTRYSARAKLAVAVVMILPAMAFFTILGLWLFWDSSRRDAITPDEERFRGLRVLLPSRGTFGYISDTGSAHQNTRRYFLTQYFVAPVVLAPDVNHEAVIANCSSAAAVRATAAANGLTIVADFGNGVALLRKSAR